MSRYSDIATALGALISGVASSGVVHTRQRWTNEWSVLLDIADGTTPADGFLFWMVRREGLAQEAGDRFSQVQETHRMVLFGALAVDDAAATYTTFQGLVESVVSAVDNRKDLGLAYVIDYGVGPSVVRTLAEEMVAGVLSHVVEIEVPVVALRDLTYA